MGISVGMPLLPPMPGMFLSMASSSKKDSIESPFPLGVTLCWLLWVDQSRSLPKQKQQPTSGSQTAVT